jgi:hypothetical protein
MEIMCRNIGIYIAKQCITFQYIQHGGVKGDGLMLSFGCLIINQTKDWTSHSKVVIRTGNRDLLNSLLLKTAEMSGNGFGKIIYNFGCRDSELRIFSQLGSGIDVLSHLLDGQDYNRLSSEATIETIN